MSYEIEIETSQLTPVTSIGSVSLLYPLLSIAQTLGLNLDKLYSDIGMSSDEIDQMDQISFAQFETVLNHIHSQVDITRLGLMLGNFFKLENFGFLGLTAASAPTIREAIQVFENYLQILVRITTIRIRPSAGPLRCVFTSQLKGHPILNAFFAASTIAVCKTLFEQISYDRLTFEIELTKESSENLDFYKDMLGQSPVYNRLRDQLTIFGLNLDAPSRLANPANYRKGLKYCEQELAKLKDRKIPSQKDKIEQVHKILRDQLETSPSLELIAKQIGMSTRTLRRTLAQKNQTYRALLNDVRFNTALTLLSEEDHPISVIAHRIGYTSAPNFSRAFKKRFGISPQAYRKKS